MLKNLLIVDEEFKERLKSVGCEVQTPLEYILTEKPNSRFRVFNLSNSLNYQEMGYYVSLLALARNDNVFPVPRTIQDLKNRRYSKFLSEEINDLLQSKLKKIKSESFELSIYFGANISSTYESISWELYRIIQAPIFRVYLEKQKDWFIKKIKILSIEEISDKHSDFFVSRVEDYFRTKKTFRGTKKAYNYDVAILFNEEEKSPPSDKKALTCFMDAFKSVGIRPSLIQYKERPNIAEYDALFIRETTNVTHHTYRMARQAENEGIYVIDDSNSILKCSNKIFLEQLMSRLKIPRPHTQIWDRKLFDQQFDSIKVPCVIKKPDSAFSQGVHKAKNKEELKSLTLEMFKSTELVLTQEFLPTDFDWRVGILNGVVLYVCKYFMAKDHWQIINNNKSVVEEGEFECIPPEKVDEQVIKTALKATQAIGRGLYGVDLKQKGDQIYLIEVNDNPSIEYGVEDKLLGKDLYLKIAEHFLRACEEKRGNNA